MARIEAYLENNAKELSRIASAGGPTRDERAGCLGWQRACRDISESVSDTLAVIRSSPNGQDGIAIESTVRRLKEAHAATVRVEELIARVLALPDRPIG